MVGVGRDLCGSSSPTPLLKQGHLRQASSEVIKCLVKLLRGNHGFKSLF